MTVNKAIIIRLDSYSSVAMIIEWLNNYLNIIMWQSNVIKLISKAMTDHIVKKHLLCKKEFKYIRTKAVIMSVTEIELMKRELKVITQIIK